LPIVNHRLQLKCVVCSKSAFAAKIVLSAANQRLLLKLCCLQELVFAAEIVFSAMISSRW
jgi:hypothetical protein